ncbi:hypothetical protein F52700_5293 [Fusarium sp. NRRL 52700]|nr:hypothetical protein F52700_5293 [Fusarium sp. NRRL 52700]
MQEALVHTFHWSSFIDPSASSRALEQATSTDVQCSSIFADTGIRIHPWESAYIKNFAKLATKVYRLVGEYLDIWLGDISPEYWTLGTLSSLYDLLFNATRHIDDPDKRQEKLGDIKLYLVTCAFADAWRGLRPTLYPRRLRDASLFFSISQKDFANGSIVDDNDASETEPSITSPERSQTNPVTRKHPATESLDEPFPKQPR